MINKKVEETLRLAREEFDQDIQESAKKYQSICRRTCKQTVWMMTTTVACYLSIAIYYTWLMQGH